MYIVLSVYLLVEEYNTDKEEAGLHRTADITTPSDIQYTDTLRFFKDHY